MDKNAQVIKQADAILFVYDQFDRGSLQSITNFWMQEISKLAKPDCVKCIIANKSDYFVKNYDRIGHQNVAIDSDEESESDDPK